MEEDIESSQVGPSSTTLHFEDINSTTSSVNDESHQSDSTSNTASNATQLVAPKKTRIVWTDSLHKKFLEAIDHIGLKRAGPNRILEFMNVPGLTRDNVSSHLQKYRLFLNTISKLPFPIESLSERIFNSRTGSGIPRVMLRNHQSKRSGIMTQQPRRFSSQLERRQSMLAPTPSMSGPYREQCAGHETSKRIYRPQLQHSNFDPLGDEIKVQQLTFGEKIPHYQPNLISNGMQSSIFGMGTYSGSASLYDQRNSAFINDSVLVPISQNSGSISTTSSPSCDASTYRTGILECPTSCKKIAFQGSNCSDPNYNNDDGTARIRLTSGKEIDVANAIKNVGGGYNGGHEISSNHKNMGPVEHETFIHSNQGNLLGPSDCASPLTQLYTNNHGQGDISMFPSNECKANTNTTNGFVDNTCNNIQSHLFGESAHYDHLYEQENYQCLYQLRGREEVIHTYLPWSLNAAEVNAPTNQLAHHEACMSYQAGGNTLLGESPRVQVDGHSGALDISLENTTQYEALYSELAQYFFQPQGDEKSKNPNFPKCVSDTEVLSSFQAEDDAPSSEKSPHGQQYRTKFEGQGPCNIPRGDDIHSTNHPPLDQHSCEEDDDDFFLHLRSLEQSLK